MTFDSRAAAHDRLAELIDELSGSGRSHAQDALDDARTRHGNAGDQLLNVAEAIISLRKGPAELTPTE
jgi:hypothetical protein